MEEMHQPVMLDEVLLYLKPQKGWVIVDATVGGGGHAEAIAQRIGPSGRIIAIDRDPKAIQVAKERLSKVPVEISFHRENYRGLCAVLDMEGVKQVNGVLFDLGVSSLQLEDASRGFSFRHDGPLDMRMDPSIKITAADILNSYSENEIERIIRVYGEERWSRRIARFVVSARRRKRIYTTSDLVKIIEDAIPVGARRGRKHPARKTFQALRIAVNNELESLRTALLEAAKSLDRAGRIVVLSYQSLEDRIVKRTLLSLAKGIPAPPGSTSLSLPLLKVLTEKPVTPSEEEREINPRSRSAKLRAAVRLEDH